MAIYNGPGFQSLQAACLPPASSSSEPNYIFIKMKFLIIKLDPFHATHRPLTAARG